MIWQIQWSTMLADKHCWTCTQLSGRIRCRFGSRSVANAGHLPGNFHSRLVSLDNKVMIADLPQHDRLRELTDYGELVAKIAIQYFEVTWKFDIGEAALIRDNVSVVDIHHVGGLDEGMAEIFVGGVRRFISGLIVLSLPLYLGRRKSQC